MKNLTYEIYLAHPEIRDQIEREVRRARAEAFDQYIITPLVSAFSKLFRRASLQFAEPDVRSGIHCNPQPRS